jgi:chaperone required for assembly of F1-ATPase|tara:strand:- start:273 stop:482 length:210 start_codon:yes stop_codon:yes gene_type:complete
MVYKPMREQIKENEQNQKVDQILGYIENALKIKKCDLSVIENVLHQADTQESDKQKSFAFMDANENEKN